MKLIAIMLVGLALVACTEEGYKGLPPLINGTSVGGGIDYVDNSNNNAFWRYVSNEVNGVVTAVSATVASANTYFDYRASLTVRKFNDSGLKKTISFNADSGFYCGSVCTIPIKLDNNDTRIYSMTVKDGELTPVKDSDGVYLFNQLTTSDEVTVLLPVAGLDAPFEAKFNLRGYDTQKMALNTLATPTT